MGTPMNSTPEMPVEFGAPVAPGTLVDIQVTVLAAGERAQQVPADTAAVDLVMKVKGTLTAEARVGHTCTVRTATGRLVEGTLLADPPTYAHGFGRPIPELVPIGAELRAILATRRS